MDSLATTALTIDTRSVAETYAFGRMLGQAVIDLSIQALVMALNGNLGAGKTALTQGIAAGLGITNRVTSPTFVFVNEYAIPTGQTLIHIDSYRLGEVPDDAALEAFTFGLDEILGRDDLIVVIEWAERLQDLLPADHLQISLTYTEATPDTRTIRCTAHGPVAAALLASIQVT